MGHSQYWLERDETEADSPRQALPKNSSRWAWKNAWEKFFQGPTSLWKRIRPENGTANIIASRAATAYPAQRIVNHFFFQDVKLPSSVRVIAMIPAVQCIVDGSDVNWIITWHAHTSIPLWFHWRATLRIIESYANFILLLILLHHPQRLWN